MFRRLAFTFLVIALTANISSAIQPEAGLWSATGDGKFTGGATAYVEFGFSVPEGFVPEGNDPVLFSSFSIYSQSRRLLSRTTTSEHIIIKTDGQILLHSIFGDIVIDGMLDSATSAHGTWQKKLNFAASGEWTASRGSEETEVIPKRKLVVTWGRIKISKR
jgi:hypothetical protein